MADARWATPATAGARHELAQVEAVASMLGTPLMPWQRQVARVATELRTDGRWRYPVVVVTVPRQSGKTTLLRAILAQRAITRLRHVEFYTAQTGKDARARWLDLVAAVETGPLQSYVEVRKGAGASALTFTRSGSSVAPFAPTPKSLHGYTPHVVMVDECFAFTEPEGVALMGAIRPAQITLPDRQLWLVSTKGPASSTWWHDWVARAHDAAGDPESGIAGFEWSMPDGMDPYSPETWAAFHPALGHTITADALAQDAESLPPGEWLRAYCNRETITSEAIIDLGEWAALATAAPPPAGTVGVGFDVARDLSAASIRAAWQDGETTYSKVIESGPGIDWLAARLAQVRDQIPGAVLVATRNGPVRQVSDQLTRAGIDWEAIEDRDFATACGTWLHRSKQAHHRHDGQPRLRAAVEAAVTRPMGETWGLSRTNSRGPIPDLVAEAVALRAALMVPDEPAPAVMFG